MRILVTSATGMEIAPFLAQNVNTDYLLSGVGVPATMYHLQKKIREQTYDCIIQAGIAGAFYDSVAIGETVLVNQDSFADLGVIEQNRFVSIFDLGFTHPNAYPYTEGWLKNNNEWLQRLAMPQHSAVTVNTVTENNFIIDEYRRIYNPAIESMEGAALHFVCLMENVPFLQLRAVSNKVGERDKSKWQIATAIQNLNNHLLEIIQVLKQH